MISDCIRALFQCRITWALAAGIGAAKLFYWLTFCRKSRVDIRDKVVVIVGASTGLGKALATQFYLAGAKVIILARSIDKMGELCRELVSMPSRPGCGRLHEPLYRYLDLADPSSIAQTMADVLKFHDGRVDILINNAGLSNRGGVETTKVEVHRQIMEVNYFGAVAVTKAVLPAMIAQKFGVVVGIGSVQGRVAIPDRSAYGASKHAFQAFHDSLRAEQTKNGIRVTMVSPGYMRTDFSLSALEADGGRHAVVDPVYRSSAAFEPEYVAEKVLRAVRTGKDELVIAEWKAHLAIFLRYWFPSFYFWVIMKWAGKRTEPLRKED